jgi:adenylylsulfate kinase
MEQRNIIWQPSTVSKSDRHKLNHHKSCVLWFTGYSGSGKSTLANELDCQFHQMGVRSYILDGDNLRHGLNKDLGFSHEDRTENIRRVGEVAKLFVESGQIVMTAFISPFERDRNHIRDMFEKAEFIEVFIDCPFAICENRDQKGLYKKARNGEISDFTGIDSAYEAPVNPELTIDTSRQTVKESAEIVLMYLQQKGMI